ncbi:sigma 54-interacting transcriptional regulator [Desulforhopalus singaporensis]|nr:sigma 54-interacting transcriptional regulator [Desulforhopalus singaporensis]
MMTKTQLSSELGIWQDEGKAKTVEIQRLTSALQESEDRYSRMLDNLKEEFLFYRHDVNGRFTYISPSYINILGFGPEEYIGLAASDLWSPHPMNKAAERATRLSCQGVRQPPYEMEIYHKSGALLRFITIETPIFDENGRVIAVEGTARDITEKRKIEDQLDKYRVMLEDLVQQRTLELEVSQKQQEDIIEFLPYPIFVVDRGGRIIAWNRAMVTMTGIEKTAVIGQNYQLWLGKFYDPSDPILVRMILDGWYDPEAVSAQKRQRLLQEHNIRIENNKVMAERKVDSLQGKDGGYIWITAGPILDRDDKIIGAIEAIRDVTEIKKAEKRIVQSERRLHTLMNNLPGMAYRISRSENAWKVDFVSNGCLQIFGRDASYFIGKKLDELMHLIHPDDLPKMQKQAGIAVENGIPFQCEYRILSGSTETKWVFDKAEILVNTEHDGSVVEGFMADFTMFKNLEKKLRSENLLLRSTIRDRYKFKNIIGNCQAMQDVFELIVKAATTDDNVFVFGESGTGKELVAHAIHEASERKEKNFVAVNCAAIPESLIESEFFGTAKGAYTGANADKQGYLEVADGGTLFLDEIGDISPNLQVKLLRAIDGGGFSPIGSRRLVRPNLRIIAASNKDLQKMVGAGNIRQDFFFRIHVVPIHLPPLRERGDDIYMLINHFLKKYGSSETIVSLSRDELETLKKYHWPGNVRELQNVLRRFITMKNLHFMELPGLQEKTEPQPEPVEPLLKVKDQNLRDTMLQVEKKVIRQALDQTRWNKSKAAKLLGVSRKTLFRKMKACGLQ